MGILWEGDLMGLGSIISVTKVHDPRSHCFSFILRASQDPLSKDGYRFRAYVTAFHSSLGHIGIRGMILELISMLFIHP